MCLVACPLALVHVRGGLPIVYFMIRGGLEVDIFAQVAEEAEPPEVRDEATTMLDNCVREAIAKAIEGDSYRSFERQMCRYMIAKARVGQGCASRYSAQVFVNLAAMVMQWLDARDINGILRGVGVKSHFGLTLDGVPMGPGHLSEHDELLPICLHIINCHTGLPWSPMLAAPALPLDGKTTEGMAKVTTETLEKHPAALGHKVCRSRVAGFGIDGACTKGGEAARHRGCQVSEKLWHDWHPQADDQSVPTCTLWDRFHQGDLGFWRAVKNSPLVQNVFDVAREVQDFFGYGRGQTLYRGVGKLSEAACPSQGKAKHLASQRGSRGRPWVRNDLTLS